jgi:hypothetical protein
MADLDAAIKFSGSYFPFRAAEICRQVVVPGFQRSGMDAFGSSLLLYTPLFQGHGALASIGAHATWNLLGYIANQNPQLGALIICAFYTVN